MRCRNAPVSNDFHARADTNEAFDFTFVRLLCHTMVCLTVTQAANSIYSKYSTVEGNNNEHRQTPFRPAVHVLALKWKCR